MNKEILINIHNYLTENKLTDSDFGTWEANFKNDSEVRNNIYGYLKENKLTDSDFSAWEGNIFGKQPAPKNTSPKVMAPTPGGGVFPTVGGTQESYNKSKENESRKLSNISMGTYIPKPSSVKVKEEETKRKINSEYERVQEAKSSIKDNPFSTPDGVKQFVEKNTFEVPDYDIDFEEAEVVKKSKPTFAYENVSNRDKQSFDAAITHNQSIASASETIIKEKYGKDYIPNYFKLIDDISALNKKIEDKEKSIQSVLGQSAPTKNIQTLKSQLEELRNNSEPDFRQLEDYYKQQQENIERSESLNNAYNAREISYEDYVEEFNIIKQNEEKLKTVVAPLHAKVKEQEEAQKSIIDIINAEVQSFNISNEKKRSSPEVKEYFKDVEEFTNKLALYKDYEANEDLQNLIKSSSTLQQLQDVEKYVKPEAVASRNEVLKRQIKADEIAKGLEDFSFLERVSFDFKTAAEILTGVDAETPTGGGFLSSVVNQGQVWSGRLASSLVGGAQFVVGTLAAPIPKSIREEGVLDLEYGAKEYINNWTEKVNAANPTNLKVGFYTRTLNLPENIAGAGKRVIVNGGKATGIIDEKGYSSPMPIGPGQVALQKYVNENKDKAEQNFNFTSGGFNSLVTMYDMAALIGGATALGRVALGAMSESTAARFGGLVSRTSVIPPATFQMYSDNLSNHIKSGMDPGKAANLALVQSFGGAAIESLVGGLEGSFVRKGIGIPATHKAFVRETSENIARGKMSTANGMRAILESFAKFGGDLGMEIVEEYTQKVFDLVYNDKVLNQEADFGTFDDNVNEIFTIVAASFAPSAAKLPSNLKQIRTDIQGTALYNLAVNPDLIKKQEELDLILANDPTTAAKVKYLREVQLPYIRRELEAFDITDPDKGTAISYLAAMKISPVNQMATNLAATKEGGFSQNLHDKLKKQIEDIDNLMKGVANGEVAIEKDEFLEELDYQISSDDTGKNGKIFYTPEAKPTELYAVDQEIDFPKVGRVKITKVTELDSGSLEYEYEKLPMTLTNKKGKEVFEPSLEKQAKDIEEGKLESFVFESLEAVPEIVREQIKNLGANSEGTIRVNMPQSLADFFVDGDILTRDGGGNIQENQEPQTKTFLGREISNGKKIYTDFDGTLFDPKTGELTPVGKELREKLDSGELTPADVEVLTARDSKQAEDIKKYFPELTISSGLSPEAKAAKVAEAGGNSIFIDDNKDNLSAAQSGEVIDAKQVVPQAPEIVQDELKPESDSLVQEGGESAVETPKKPKPNKVNVLGKETNIYNDYIPQSLEEVEADAMYVFNSDTKEGIPSLLHGVAYKNDKEVNGVKSENWHATISGSDLQKLYPTKPVTPTTQSDSTSKLSDVDNRKQKQLEIINKENPAPNDYNTWVRKVEDIKTAEEAFATAEQEGAMYPDFTENDMQDALNNGEVTVYSSFPIKEGVFVSPSKMNAQEYAGGKDGKLYSKKIKLEDVAWIDEGEGQYAPVKTTQEPEQGETTQGKAEPIVLEDFSLERSDGGKIGPKTYTKVGDNWQYQRGSKTETVRKQSLIDQLNKQAGDTKKQITPPKEVTKVAPKPTPTPKTTEPTAAKKPKDVAAKKAEELALAQEKVKEIANKLNALKVKSTKTGPRMSLFGVDVLITELGAPLWNRAVDMMAKQIEAGTSFGKAIAAVVDYVDSKMKGKKWDKKAFENAFNSLNRPKVNFQILGEKGAAALDAVEESTRRLDNLQVAREMEAAGKDAKTIRLATEWEKGKDGKWKYEIDTSNVSINFNLDSVSKLGKKYNLENIIDFPKLFEAFPEFRKLKVSISKDGGSTTEGYFDGKQIVLGIESEKLKTFLNSKKVFKEFDELPKEVKNVIAYEAEKLKLDRELRIGDLSYEDKSDILDSKFPEYPNKHDILLSNGMATKEDMEDGPMKSLAIRFGEPTYRVVPNKKYYDILFRLSEKSNFEVDNLDLINLNDVLKPVLLHEIQHAIQKKEGFAAGGNTYKAYDSLSKEEKEYYNNLVKEHDNVVKYLKDRGLSVWELKGDEKNNILDVMGKPGDFLYMKYKSIAGEVEANNVQERMNLTPEQRQQALLQETEDVARKDQIIILDSFDNLQQSLNRAQETNNVIQQVVDQLKKTGLAKEVFQLDNEGIAAKLEELGVDADIARQVAAYHNSPLKTFSKDGKLNLFLNGLNNIKGLQTNPFNNREYIYGDNLVNLEINRFGKQDKNEIALQDISAIEKGKGSAKAAMNDIISVADSLNYKITLEAKPFGTDSSRLEIRNLVSFYKSFGFKVDLSVFENEFKSDEEYIKYVEENPSESVAMFRDAVSKSTPVDIKEVRMKKAKGDRGEFDGEFDVLDENNNVIGSLYWNTDKTWRDPNYERNNVYDVYGDILGYNKKEAIEEVVRRYNKTNIAQFQKDLKKGIQLTPKGFTHNGNVYLNTDAATLDTPIHEFQHLHLNWLKENRKEVYDRGLELIKNELQGTTDSPIKDVIDYVNQTQPDLKGEALRNEILAELLGRDGLQLLESYKGKVEPGSIMEWLQQAWDNIKSMLGLSGMTNQEIMDLNLGDYVRAMNVDLMSGESSFKKAAQITKAEAIKRNNGNLLNLAPNGKPSILYQSYKDLGYSESETERLVSQVYSDNFFNFFGDWINDAENSSKVVDANGQPLLTYHGSPNSFTEFDTKKKGSSTKAPDTSLGFFFAESKDQALKYGNNIFPSFLNIRNLSIERNLVNYFAQKNSIETLKDYRDDIDTVREYLGDFISSYWGLPKNFTKEDIQNKIDKEVDTLNKLGNPPNLSGYDGLKTPMFKSKDVSQYIAFNPNQIKSATENIGTFDSGSNDIRFQKSEETKKQPSKTKEQAQQNLKDAAKNFFKVFVYDPNKTLGIRSKDFKGQATDQYKAFMELLYALGDMARLSFTTKELNTKNVKAMLESVKDVINLNIDNDLVQDVIDSAKNLTNIVEIVNPLKKEIAKLSKQFESYSQNTAEFAGKVSDLLTQKVLEATSDNRKVYFTPTEAKRLIEQASKIETETDLSEFENTLDKMLGDKDIQDKKEKIDKLKKLAQRDLKNFNGPTETKNRIKAALSFNHKNTTAYEGQGNNADERLQDRRDQINADLDAYTDFLNTFLGRVKNDKGEVVLVDISSDPNSPINKFSKKAKEQVERASKNLALKDAEFDSKGNLLDPNGNIVTKREDLSKPYLNELLKREMAFDEDGNLVDKDGNIIKDKDSLNSVEKTERAKRETAERKGLTKEERKKSFTQEAEVLVDEALDLLKEGLVARPLSSMTALQNIIDNFLALTEADIRSLVPAEINTASDLKDLKKLVSGYKHLTQVGLLSNGLENLIARAKGKDKVKGIRDNLAKSSGKVRNLLRDFWRTPLPGVGVSLSNMTDLDKAVRFISNIPLARIDAAISGKEVTQFHDDLVRPLAVSYDRFTSFLNKTKADLRKLTKDVKYDDRVALYFYALGRQKAFNMDNPEVKSVEQEMIDAEDHALNDSNYAKGEYKKAKEIYDNLVKEMGGTFDYTKIKLSPGQQRLLDYFDQSDLERKGKVLATASRTGKEVRLYDGYAPISRIPNTKITTKEAFKSFQDFIDAALSQNIPIADSTKERSVNKSPLKNWDFAVAHYDSSKDLELDYNMRQAYNETNGYMKEASVSLTFDIRQTKTQIAKETDPKVLEQLNNDLEKLENSRVFMDALSTVIKRVTTDNIISKYEDVNQFSALLKELGYSSVLASLPRAVSEFASNLLFASFPMYSGSLIRGATNLMKDPTKFKESMEDLYTFITLLDTAQASRLLGHSGSLYRDMDQSSPDLFLSKNSVLGRAAEGTSEAMKNFNNFLNSVGDRAIATPLWYGSFTNKYNKIQRENADKEIKRGDYATDKEYQKAKKDYIKNNSFDIKRYNTDSDYRFANKDAIKAASKKADEDLSQGFSSFNPYESIPDLHIKNSADVVELTNKFLQRFIRFEYQSAEDAVSSMMGRGSLSRTEGLQLLGATITRMAAYTLITKDLASAYYTYVLMPGVNGLASLGTNVVDILRDLAGDDEEDLFEYEGFASLFKGTQILSPTIKEPKDWESDTKKSILGSALQLIFGRHLGAWAKIPINWGIEQANILYGQDLGLREDDSYQAFKDGLLFNQIQGPPIAGVTKTDSFPFRQIEYKDANAYAVVLKTALSLTGPFSPFLGDITDLTVNRARKGEWSRDHKWLLNKDFHEELAKAEYLVTLSKVRLFGTNFLPIPAQRDIKRVIKETQSALDFGIPIDNKEVQKALTPEATEEDVELGREALTTIREEDYNQLLKDVKKKFNQRYVKDARDGLPETKDEDFGKIVYKGEEYVKDYTQSAPGKSVWIKTSDGSQVRKEENINILDSLNINFADYNIWNQMLIDLRGLTLFHQIKTEDMGFGIVKVVGRRNPLDPGEKDEDVELEFTEYIDLRYLFD